MALTGMLRYGDELTCDMAQYYHIVDYRGLPVETLAALACGLPEDSRVIRKLTGAKTTPTLTLLAAIADRLGLLVWLQTKDGQKGRNRPKSILSELMKETEEKPQSFETPEDFEAERARILRGG